MGCAVLDDGHGVAEGLEAALDGVIPVVEATFDLLPEKWSR